MNQLTTVFSEHMDKNNVLTEYPRPNLKRDSYINLNGYWDYAFTKTEEFPRKYDGRILVPFSPEAKLSGVERILQPNEYLWYYRSFATPTMESDNRLILHFGAIDQHGKVYINGHLVKEHMGGYLPFSVDITPYLHEQENTLQVLVRDVTDSSYHSRGKQKLNSGGMFYTPQSGIWQTVWMEVLPSTYMKELKITPIFDESKIKIEIQVEKDKKQATDNGIIEIKIFDGLDMVCMNTINKVDDYTGYISIPNAKAWSPESPHLYSLFISFLSDKVESYFGMRKYSIDKDEKGITRLFLNNKPYFHNGLLDQGYWPEGLYTAPTDEALRFDIIKAKELGFNMLRKHAKVEPLRWYYHCDKIGMLVWQDMVNGGSSYNSKFVTYFPNVLPGLAKNIKDNNYQLFSRRDEEGKEDYRRELKEMISSLYHFPSIAMWVPFNEGWGQFDSLKIVEEIRELDSSRTIDHASGWFDQKGGDVKSHHIYFTSFCFKPEERAVVLSEFGGYVYRVEGHYYSNKSYGYRTYKTKEALTKAYKNLYEKKIIPAKEYCLSASVYTQITDIEEEINGLYTYDRKILKINENVLKKINHKLRD